MRTRHRGAEMRQTALDCLIDIQNANAHTGADCGPLDQEQTLYCPHADISHTTTDGCVVQFLLDNGWTQQPDGGNGGGGGGGGGVGMGTIAIIAGLAILAYLATRN